MWFYDYWGFIVFGICLICEHIGKIYHLSIRPTSVLVPIANFLQTSFSTAGKLFGKLSSFLAQLDLQELGQSIFDLGMALAGIIGSPSYFFFGYLQYAASYVNRSIMIYMGSVVLIAGVVCGMYHLMTSMNVDSAYLQWYVWILMT